jgi:hypothetical protein
VSTISATTIPTTIPKLSFFLETIERGNFNPKAQFLSQDNRERKLVHKAQREGSFLLDPNMVSIMLLARVEAVLSSSGPGFKRALASSTRYGGKLCPFQIAPVSVSNRSHRNSK